MLRYTLLLAALTLGNTKAALLQPRQGLNGSTTASPSVETITVVPVSASPASSTATISSTTASTSSQNTASTSVPYDPYTSFTTKYYTQINTDGSTTTITGVIPLAVTTRAATSTLSYLGTTVTYNQTITYDAEYPPDMINGIRCQYFGIQCPTSTTYTGSIGTLFSKDHSLSVSSYLSQCSKTLNLASATADATSTVTSIILLPPTTYGGDGEYTTITTIATKPPASKVGCCGACTLTFSNVDVYYFVPDYWGTSQCVPVGGTPPTSPAAASPTANPNATYVPSGASTTTMRGSSFVNSNGYTFVSPSVYVAFTSVSGSNICGQVGGYYDNFTLGFAPGELSTEYRPLGGFGFGPPPATWPWDVNSVTCGDRPIIAFPDKLRTAIDPAWSTCTQDPGSEWQGNDPPFALTPQAALALTTPGNSNPTPTPAQPITTPNAGEPSMTSESSLNVHTATSKVAPAGGISNNDPQTNSITPQTSIPSNPDPPAGNSSPAAAKNTPTTSAIVIVPVTTTNANGQTITTSVYSLSPGGSTGSAGGSVPGLGQPIATPIGAQPIPSPTPTPTPIPITIGSQTASVLNPSSLAIGGTTLSAGGAALITGGSTISVAPGGSVVVNGVTSALPTPSASGSTPSIIVLGPGTTLTEGAGTTTISGTPYAFGTGGLVIGTSTVPLPQATGTGSIAGSIAGSGSGSSILTGDTARGMQLVSWKFYGILVACVALLR